MSLTADRRAAEPGAIDPRVTQQNIHETICVPGSAKSVRPPVAVTKRMKRQVMQEYGMTEEPAEVEGDHLIPISVGGCPGPDDGCDFHANFFPQLWTGPKKAHDKDKIEWAIHRATCSGRISLQDAQTRIVTDWKHALHTSRQMEKCSATPRVRLQEPCVRG
jgi:hypothetical protein